MLLYVVGTETIRSSHIWVVWECFKTQRFGLSHIAPNSQLPTEATWQPCLRQISETSNPKVGSCLVSGNGTPAPFQGNFRLVKYDSIWPDSCFFQLFLAMPINLGLRKMTNEVARPQIWDTEGIAVKFTRSQTSNCENSK